MSEISTNQPNSISVSELNRAVASTLQSSFSALWVKGELSALTRATSGHWYFTLKDGGAQVKCVMYRNRAQTVSFVPKEGEQLMLRAVVSFYEPRGEFQLQVEQIRKVGLGDLFEAFLRLKAKLQSEGLFDPARKKTLPYAPARVGIVTSAQAAALADVLRSFARRAPHVCLVIYPTLVQGQQAPELIATCIDQASARQDVDVLLIVRGGGSIEDLWAFNSEVVARAIARCSIPTISGVGHETDTTIADFVADMRAATPTAAAELATPAQAELVLRYQTTFKQAHRLLSQRLLQAEQRIDRAVLRLKSPAQHWSGFDHKLNQWASRMSGAMYHRLEQNRWALLQQTRQLPNGAKALINSKNSALETNATKLTRLSQYNLKNNRNRLEKFESILHALSPKRVLDRGYAVVQTTDGTVVSQIDQATLGEHVLISLSDGQLSAQIEQVHTRGVD